MTELPDEVLREIARVLVEDEQFEFWFRLMKDNVHTNSPDKVLDYAVAILRQKFGGEGGA